MAGNDVLLRMSQLSDEIGELMVEAERLQHDILAKVGDRSLHVKYGVAAIRAVDHLQHAQRHLRGEGRTV